MNNGRSSGPWMPPVYSAPPDLSDSVNNCETVVRRVLKNWPGSFRSVASRTSGTRYVPHATFYEELYGRSPAQEAVSILVACHVWLYRSVRYVSWWAFVAFGEEIRPVTTDLTTRTRPVSSEGGRRNAVIRSGASAARN